MDSATASPNLIPSMPSERQWTPAASRPSDTFVASLFNSPPTVRGGPLYGSRESPSSEATTGFGMTNVSLKSALSIVTPAAPVTAWAAGYDGCAGEPPGYGIGKR